MTNNTATHTDDVKTLYTGFEPRRVIQKRSIGTWIIASVILLIALALFVLILTRPAIDWSTIGNYLFSPSIMTGLWVTLYLTLIAQAIGIFVGLMLALMARSQNPLIQWMATSYVWVFRAIPTLVQLLFWFNLASLFPIIQLGVPGLPPIWEGSPNLFMTPLLAACLALGLQESAYMAEIIRGGLQAVDRGQQEAASALGLSRLQSMSRIVIPQAMRAIIPPTGNQLISMLKYTSLASVISLNELLSTAQQIYNNNFQVIPLLVVATIWYLVLVSVFTLGQRQLEKYFSRGFASQPVRRRKQTEDRSTEAAPPSAPGAIKPGSASATPSKKGSSDDNDL